MSDKCNAPVGVFDSGVGGLTVAREIMRNLPEENIVYFGDTARVPYGTKSKDTVLRYSRQIIRFLKTQDVKAIVIACNTASAYALEDVEKELDIPIIGVVKPGAKVACEATHNKKIGVIATEATINSGIYSSYITRQDPQIQVIGKACPLFVPLVEEGWLKDSVTFEVAGRYLRKLMEQDIDTLILGCTHYPLLRSTLREIVGEKVTLVNPAYETARELKQLLAEKGLTNIQSQEEARKYQFYVSDQADKFMRFADSILPFDVNTTKKISIREEKNTMRLGALEAGGTKMVCAIGNANGEIYERISIPTETPEITVPKMIEYFKEKDIQALGIGCFGPIDLNRKSETYGYITTTPKLAWKNYNIVGAFADALDIPVGFDTDVNGSALGEATWGITKGLDNSIYITIGTGVGMGIISNGKLLHGMLHPEGGHVLLTRHPKDTYGGKCPYHSNCLEGLAAGPAIEARWGKKGIELADKKEVWELEAYYIGQALVDCIMLLSPQRIVLGGGVMHQEHMMPLVREEVKKQLNGYLVTKELEDLDSYIVLPSLNDNQGIMGALKLAVDELAMQ